MKRTHKPSRASVPLSEQGGGKRIKGMPPYEERRNYARALVREFSLTGAACYSHWDQAKQVSAITDFAKSQGDDSGLTLATHDDMMDAIQWCRREGWL